jgi:hypothetical protein
MKATSLPFQPVAPCTGGSLPQSDRDIMSPLITKGDTEADVAMIAPW